MLWEVWWHLHQTAWSRESQHSCSPIHQALRSGKLLNPGIILRFTSVRSSSPNGPGSLDRFFSWLSLQERTCSSGGRGVGRKTLKRAKSHPQNIKRQRGEQWETSISFLLHAHGLPQHDSSLWVWPWSNCPRGVGKDFYHCQSQQWAWKPLLLGHEKQFAASSGQGLWEEHRFSDVVCYFLFFFAPF